MLTTLSVWFYKCNIQIKTLNIFLVFIVTSYFDYYNFAARISFLWKNFAYDAAVGHDYEQ